MSLFNVSIKAVSYFRNNKTSHPNFYERPKLSPTNHSEHLWNPNNLMPTNIIHTNGIIGQLV